MKTTRSYSALIHSIEKIYLKVALTALQKRMAGYHKLASQAGKAYTPDIKSTLLKYVDEIIKNHQDGQGGPHDVDGPVISGTKTGPRSHATPAFKPYVVNKENVGELSRYFKARMSGAGLHHGIEEKLEHATWEHIHAAIRYARRGDKSNAKLHADIASSACKELVHYMADDRYREFIAEIDRELETLKSEII